MDRRLLGNPAQNLWPIASVHDELDDEFQRFVLTNQAEDWTCVTTQLTIRRAGRNAIALCDSRSAL